MTSRELFFQKLVGPTNFELTLTCTPTTEGAGENGTTTRFFILREHTTVKQEEESILLNMSEQAQNRENEYTTSAAQAVDKTEAVTVDSMSKMPTIALRITCPGGRKVTLHVSPYITSVHQIKRCLEIEHGTTKAEYLRLICRGKKIEDEYDTLAGLGILKPSAIMAVHNEFYAADQEGINAIEKLLQEAEAIRNISDLVVVHERVTQLCCQIDGIRTHGSRPLRLLRKSALDRVQAIEQEKREAVESTVDKAETVDE